MKSLICHVSRLPAKLILLGMVMILAACQSGNRVSSTGSVPGGQDLQNIPIKNGPATGEVIGSGAARVALLLPLSAPGNGSMPVVARVNPPME